MARELASETTETSLLAKQLSDGDLWETSSSGFCRRLWTLEACSAQVIYEGARHQLVQRQEYHGHESCLWRVLIFVLLIIRITMKYWWYWSYLNYLCIQVCSSADGPWCVGLKRCEHKFPGYTSHNLWERPFWYIPWLVRILQHLPSNLRSPPCWSSLLKAEAQVLYINKVMPVGINIPFLDPNNRTGLYVLQVQTCSCYGRGW